MTRKIQLNPQPDPEINSLDRRTGNTQLHTAVEDLNLTAVVDALKRGANVNAHQRGNKVTALDLLFRNVMEFPLIETFDKIKTIADIARVLLENGAKVDYILAMELSFCLANNRMPNQSVTLDKEVRDSLWMCLALCGHYNALKPIKENETFNLSYGFPLNASYLIAIVEAAIARHYNRAIKKGLIDDAAPIVNFIDISKAAKAKLEAENAANIARCNAEALEHYNPAKFQKMHTDPQNAPSVVDKMNRAAITVQFMMLRNSAKVKVAARKEEVRKLKLDA